MVVKLISISFFVLILVSLSKEDIYLHNPRGSNNRLNEASATRTNGNRLFDSENNDRGGYNVGDATEKPFKSEKEQYQMKYFQSGSEGSSYLDVEWTAQHGCGGNDNNPTKQNCQLILQYACQPKTDFSENNLNRIRDGLRTNSQGYTNMREDTSIGHEQRKQQDVKIDLGLQETWESYDQCNYRSRNAGLFTADQNLKNNDKGYSSAVFTRQNPNGARSGYECSEERDYYPYWHPSMWKDITILTSNISDCERMTKESFNMRPKHLCIEVYNDGTQKHWSKWNNQQDCQANNGKWIELHNYLEKATQFKDQISCESRNYKWNIPYDSTNVNQKECLIPLEAPVCQQAEWSRSNHLGATSSGKPASFEWKLPFFPSNRLQTCVLRIRYNISTDDYDPFTTDSKLNGQKSPVRNNPQINVGANNRILRLAINTAQYGRVFQDRSHSFLLLPRPRQVANELKIFNLNVKGKRGNIVQVYPAIEYAFVPDNLIMNKNDLLHIQWTGSNTHNNGAPGGDGQTGDDGQGQGGTDRNNFVQINSLSENFPIPYEISNIWKEIEVLGFMKNNTVLNDDPSTYLRTLNSDNFQQDVALYFSSSSYYECVSKRVCGEQSYESKKLVDADLNVAPASFPGVLIKFTRSNSIYYFMSSRNNNFSNRSQKGKISVN